MSGLDQLFVLCEEYAGTVSEVHILYSVIFLIKLQDLHRKRSPIGTLRRLNIKKTECGRYTLKKTS